MNSNRKQHSDYWLSLVIFGLICFGLIMIYSVSKYYSLDLSDGATDKYYLKKQLFPVSLGMVGWVILQAIDYRIWQKYAGRLLLLTVGLLLLPLALEPFGVANSGRWINIYGFNFQPAELAKLSFTLYLAALFAKQSENLTNIKRLFWPFIGIVGAVALFMLMQKDLGTLAIFVVISASIFVVAGAPLYQIGASGALAVFLLWLAVKIEPYRMQRLLTFLNPANDGLASGYHIKNALIAIGSGGLWGLGFGQSKQKYLYLPEAHTDSIFAIICEELGAVRAAVIILAFVFIAIRGLKIAKNAPDIFSRLVASGVTIWLFAQMTINIAAMFSLVPLTGIPLPFISYGGTSVVVLLMAVGILTNISKFSNTSK